MNEDKEKWEALFKQKLLVDNVSYSELREILIGMRDIGLDSNFACNVLQNLRNSIELTEEEEDRILAWMDVVVGWCSPAEDIW